MDAIHLRVSLFLSLFTLGCSIASTQNSDAFERGLRRVVEDIKQSHPEIDKDLHKNESQNTGSLFYKFPCKRLDPSPTKPTSVHKLRPGDVDIVAAIGDSLTAAKAAGSRGLNSLLHDYRGLSWSAGGDGTFQTLHSLPNILKEYNPDIYGFSNSIGDYMSHESGFNVAKSGATSLDLAFQAALLIQKLKNDPKVDYQNDWKLITILIGGNDLCRSCHSLYNPRLYLRHLKSTLDMLKASLPRTFINLVEIMPVELVRNLPRGLVCERIQSYYCPCAAFPKSEEDYKRLIEERKEFQKNTEKLILSGEYETSDDFTVVLQPFFRNAKIPRVPETKEVDYSLFAVDCFHYSKKGHSLTGLSLWNNMLQPFNNKTTDWTMTDKILCPSESHHFLATKKNSPFLNGGKDLTPCLWKQKETSSPAKWTEIIMNSEVKPDTDTNKKPSQEDIENIKEEITIMVIATIGVVLLLILAGVFYFGLRLIRQIESGPYEKI